MKRTKNKASFSEVFLLYLMILLGFALLANADTVTVYTYTGNSFTNFNGSYACPPQCSLTGVFTVAGLPPANLSGGTGLQFDFNVLPLAYSFTDGHVTATNANSCYDFFTIGTDSSGNITAWTIRIFTPATNAPCGGGGIYTGVQLLSQGGVIDITIEAPAATNFAASLPNTGTWTTQVVPAGSKPFSGFFPPVSNPPVLNEVKGGQAIPVKFSLDGYQGLDIFTTGYPASQQINCITDASLNDVQQTVTAGGSSLTYDPNTDQYTYAWKTDKSWGGTCRQLTVQLTDGIAHVVNFQFK